jgi:hypothetical protein
MHKNNSKVKLFCRLARVRTLRASFYIYYARDPPLKKSFKKHQKNVDKQKKG